MASDGGRVCRPLVIADNGVSRIKHHHMKELKVGDITYFIDNKFDAKVSTHYANHLPF